MAIAQRRKILGALAACAGAGLARVAPPGFATGSPADVPPSRDLMTMLGQLLVVHVRYLPDKSPQQVLGAAARAMLQEVQPGGVVLYGSNIASAGQVKSLIADMRGELRIAPFIAVDEEGGRVTRLQAIDGSRVIAPARELARQGMPAVSAAYGQIGAELAALGINMDLAPVADLGLHPEARFLGDRAFSDDPAIVARAVVLAIEALRAHGIMAVVKHFPGHGRTREDSHREASLVTASRDELELDLAPFRAAFAARVAGLMTAHVAYPALDASGALASVSAPILQQLARGEMAFDGLIMTDAIEMRGLGRRRSEADAAQQAFLAGADLLMGATDPRALRDHLARSLDPAASVEDDGIAARMRARLADSHARIIGYKRRYAIA